MTDTSLDDKLEEERDKTEFKVGQHKLPGDYKTPASTNKEYPDPLPKDHPQKDTDIDADEQYNNLY